jgi:hypothetical protein
MSGAACPHEAAVTRAARSGAWPESLAAHVAGCARCREIVQTSRWMRALAHGSEPAPDVPDATLVWWRAQLSERRAKPEKTGTLLEWLAVASGGAVPLALAGWVAWNWFLIQGQAARMLAGWLPQFWAGAYALASLAPAALFLAALSLAYPLLSRD